MARGLLVLLLLPSSPAPSLQVSTMQFFLRRDPKPQQRQTYAQMAARPAHRKPLPPRRAPLTGGFRTPPPRERRPAISEELFPHARLFFKVIKCRHHLFTLSAMPPKSLMKTARSLQSNLHPAFINDDFRSAARTAADTWLDSVVDALLSHYRVEIRNAESAISEVRLSPDSLDECLTIATSWAKRQLSKKLNALDLEDTCQRIRALAHLVTDVPQHDCVPPQGPKMRSISAQTDCSFLAAHGDKSTQATSPTSPKPKTPRSARKKRPRPRVSSPPFEKSQPDLFDSPPQQPQPSKRRVASVTDDQLVVLGEDPSAAGACPQTPTAPQANESSERTSSIAPSASVQLNLFGTPLSTKKKDNTSASTSFFDACEENVIVGDSNLCDFQLSSCTVFAHANGRLSHYKALLAATKESHEHVTRFLLCLSTLDSSNNFCTNSTTLKSVLGAARRVFPQAQLFVLLLGHDPSLPTDVIENIQALNNFVICKHPSSCLHMTAPDTFSVNNHEWSSSTKQSVYSKIKDSLNYE